MGKSSQKKSYLCAPNYAMQEFDVNFKEFNIAFIGLKPGLHTFQYRLNESFFQKFEYSLLHDADINVQLYFVKSERLFDLKFQLTGTIKTECDRCLAIIDYPISSEYEVMVKMQQQTVSGHDRNKAKDNTDDLDIVYINPEADHINVAQLIYEFAVLSMPVMAAMPLDDLGNPQCPPNVDGQKPCNEKVLAVLQQGVADNNDSNSDNTPDNDNIDPRWAALKKLKE